MYREEKNSNHLTYTIPNCTGNRYVLGDIHGCNKTFYALLEKFAPTKTDQVFILGDMINRGKNSTKVVKHIMKLKSEGYMIYPLRGNHEQLLIRYFTEMPSYFYTHFLKRRNMKGFIDKDGKVKEKYFTFLTQLPFYFEFDNTFLVHAGFNTFNPLTNTKAMLNTRNTEYSSNFLWGKRIIHAHTPVDLSEIKWSVENNERRINLDNGCILHKRKPEKGNLVCLNLNNKELIIQPNIDYD